MNIQEPNGGWNEWSRHVLLELERLDGSIQKLVKSTNEIGVDIATLKVKAGAWGALAGIIVVMASILVQLLVKE